MTDVENVFDDRAEIFQRRINNRAGFSAWSFVTQSSRRRAEKQEYGFIYFINYLGRLNITEGGLLAIYFVKWLGSVMWYKVV